jgi:hypothetical protein
MAIAAHFFKNAAKTFEPQIQTSKSKGGGGDVKGRVCMLSQAANIETAGRFVICDITILVRTVGCSARGTSIRAAFSAQKAVLTIRPPGGHAGWVKMNASRMIRTPCQAKGQVTVSIVSPTQTRLLFLLSCALSQMVLSLRSPARFSGPSAATEARMPLFCMISLRLCGFRTPRWKQRQKRVTFDEVFAKHKSAV